MNDLKEKALNFISQKLDLIQNEDWKNFYYEAVLTFLPTRANSASVIGEITKCLQESGIDPFTQGLNYIPGGYFSFYSPSLREFTIPENIKTITGYSFTHNMGITTLYIPETVKNIHTDAFTNMEDLTSCIWESTQTSIPVYGFNQCHNLRYLLLPKSIKIIGDKAFNNCNSLKQIDYEGTMEEWDNIVKLGEWKGYYPSLEKIKCVDGVINL